MLMILAEASWITQTAAVDSTYGPRPVRRPRSSRCRPPHSWQRERREDGTGHVGGSSGLHTNLRKAGIMPVIPGTRARKCPICHDKRRYKDRWRAEAVFCRLKDFHRVATRYDKLARNYASAVALAAIIAFWC